MVTAVDENLREHRRFTITTLALNFHQVSISVFYKTVAENLNFQKLCSRWVSKLLTENHKKKRLECALDFLGHFDDDGDEMLSQTVTGDEIWISHITPESKQQSMECRHTESPTKVKANKCFPIARPWQQCSGTDEVFF